MMTDTDLNTSTREFVTAAVNLAVASACRQAGHADFDALVSGIMVGLVHTLAAIGPEHLPKIEAYLERIGPVILDDVRMVMTATAEQNPVRPLSVATMQ